LSSVTYGHIILGNQLFSKSNSTLLLNKISERLEDVSKPSTDVLSTIEKLAEQYKRIKC
jgi:hypothetical protein